MNHPLSLALIATVVTALLSGQAQGSNTPRGTTFPGTIEDGTPKVIRMKKTTVTEEIEEAVPRTEAPAPAVAQTPVAPAEAPQKEEFLEDLVTTQQAPAPIAVAPSMLETQEALSAPLAAQPEIAEKTPEVTAKTPEVPRTAGLRIPQDKKQDIVKRIKYAAYIAQHYGIAYDYRVMTVSDFSRVLKKLKAAKN